MTTSNIDNPSNVDEQEIAKFEALAYRWWDKESEFKPLHDINPLRLNFIDERAHLAGKKVLDIGCGGGILSESMAQRGAQVKGIDLGEAPLAVAKIHAKLAPLARASCLTRYDSSSIDVKKKQARKRFRMF